jgi:F0F1-type ATP synthase membrane subunit c/vacuolar-type H+-ATPase subunit K
MNDDMRAALTWGIAGLGVGLMIGLFVGYAAGAMSYWS